MGCNCREKARTKRFMPFNASGLHVKHQGVHSLIDIPKQHDVLTNSADLASMTAITKIWYQSEWAGLKGELELEPVTNDGA